MASWNDIIVELYIGVQVHFWDNHRVCIYVDDHYYGSLYGICGNYNNSDLDDYYTKQGIDVNGLPESGDLISNSWEVPQQPWSDLDKSCWCPANTREHETRRKRSDTGIENTACEQMKEFEHCFKTIPSLFEYYLNACMFDMNAREYKEGSHCDIIESMVRDCAELSDFYIEGWREKFNCPCPDGSFKDPCQLEGGRKK